MKKYMPILFVFAFIFIFNINTANALVPGCSGTSGFSTTTGESCAGPTTSPTTSLPEGCTSTEGYSPTTGVKCDSGVTPPVSSYPEGCTSSSGFSPTTGEPCGGSSSGGGGGSTSTSCYNFTANLQVGSVGADVVALQTFLVSKGFRTIMDGHFGRLTYRALRSYQESVGLPATGLFDVLTRVQVTANCSSTANNSPVITGVSGPQSLNVNQQGTWIVRASSPNGGNLSYSVIWGDEADGTQKEKQANLYKQSATFNHSYLRAGIYAPTFYVVSENTIHCITTPCPSNAGSAQTSLSVNVGNVISPVIVTYPNGGETIQKGKQYTFAWSVSSFRENRTNFSLELIDALNNPVKNFDAMNPIPSQGTRQIVLGQGTSNSYQIVITDTVPDGSYKFRVSLCPGDGAATICLGTDIKNMVSDTSNSSFTITSNTTSINNKPIIEIFPVPNNIPVGQPVNFNFNAIDADNDNLSWGVDWGDVGGTSSCPVNVPIGTAQNWNYNTSHTWNATGKYTVTVNVFDCRGGNDLESFTVNVENTTTPSIAVISPNGGETYTSNSSSIPVTWNVNYSPSSVQVHLYSPTEGDVYVSPVINSTLGQQYAAIPTGATFPAGKYKINVCDDTKTPLGLPGKSLCDSSDNYFTITSGNSTNSSPKIVAFPAIPTNIQPGQTVNISLSAKDGDNDDLSWSVDWGEGVSSTSSCSAVRKQTATGWNFSDNHKWAQAGTYQVKIYVSDCVGGTDSYSFSITVGNITPTTPTPPTVTINASPKTVVAGQSSTFTWSSTNATSCKAIVNGYPIDRPTSGSQTLKITSSLAVKMTCTGPGGTSREASVIVNVVSSTSAAQNVLGAESFNFTQFLTEGSYGNEVTELQKFLNAAGYDPGNPDGVFGPKVKEALIKFQTANKLKSDGIVGYEVRSFLNK